MDGKKENKNTKNDETTKQKKKTKSNYTQKILLTDDDIEHLSNENVKIYQTIKNNIENFKSGVQKINLPKKLNDIAGREKEVSA